MPKTEEYGYKELVKAIKNSSKDVQEEILEELSKI